MIQRATPARNPPAESWWWCRRCHQYRELEDPGDAFPRCAHCGSHKIEQRPPPATHAVRVPSERVRQWFERMRRAVDRPDPNRRQEAKP